jgi:hypothetical protein
LLRQREEQPWRATLAGSLDSSRLLFVADAGLHYNFVRMEEDALYAVKDTAGFQWTARSSSPLRRCCCTSGSPAASARQSFRLEG